MYQHVTKYAINKKVNLNMTKIIFFRQEDKKKQNRFKIRLKIGLRFLPNTKFMEKYESLTVCSR